jgi:hypothetical protein
VGRRSQGIHAWLDCGSRGAGKKVVSLLPSATLRPISANIRSSLSNGTVPMLRTIFSMLVLLLGTGFPVRTCADQRI